MTDTHDTNLPEKPVELEEEKKTAEVSEPATTETPAEEIVSKKPVESVLKLTKEEILAKLKEVVADVENVAKPEIDGLKQSFYKLHNAEQDAARKLFIENGGAAENFVPQTDCVEEEFKNIMSVIKEKRSALTAELEKQKEMNLQGQTLLRAVPRFQRLRREHRPPFQYARRRGHRPAFRRPRARPAQHGQAHRGGACHPDPRGDAGRPEPRAAQAHFRRHHRNDLRPRQDRPQYNL